TAPRPLRQSSVARRDTGCSRCWTSTGVQREKPVSAHSPRTPAGTLTFLFTDIVNSTGLWERYRGAMDRALRRHDVLLREAITRHHGRVFSVTGDGFAAAFPGAHEAIDAALAAQIALRTERWVDDVKVEVRMGVHTGEAIGRDGNYFGSAVNRASRV